MISGTYRKGSEFDCIQARLEEIEENVEVSPPTLVKWQEMLVALEERVLRAEEELSTYKKHVPFPIPEAIYHRFRHR